MEIFDIHHHLGSLTGGSLQEGAGWQDRDYSNRVRIMESNGVTMAAILAATGYIQADGIKDTMRSNDTVAAYRKRDPKRFPVACGTVEPLHGVRSLGELERMKQELHLQGVVWHNRFQGVAIDHQRMRPLAEKSKRVGTSTYHPHQRGVQHGSGMAFRATSFGTTGTHLCCARCVNDECK